MKKTLYIIKNLGIGKSTLFVILYPLHFLRNALKRLDDIHNEMRWHILIYNQLLKLPKQKSQTIRKINKEEVPSIFKTFTTPINVDWFYFYRELNETESNYFIPDNIFFREIEPTLNNRTTSFYSDKNSYSLIFGNYKQPETILRYINSKFFDSDYNQLSTKDALINIKSADKPWIIKPSVGSGGGKNVCVGIYKQGNIVINNNILLLNDLKLNYKRGFIIQNKLEQCDDLAKFHPASLNTFRIITLRLNFKIHYLSGLVKFGVNNNPVDNSATGAVWCGMNPDGSMKPSGLTYGFHRVTKHPTSGQSLKNVHFSYFNDVVNFAKDMHKRLIHLDIVSWDIAVSQNREPVLIEFNTKFQGIIGCQTENGPLFGDLTNDVLSEIVKRRKAYRS